MVRQPNVALLINHITLLKKNLATYYGLKVSYHQANCENYVQKILQRRCRYKALDLNPSTITSTN